MGIFETMQKLTKGNSAEIKSIKSPVAKPGDIIEGVISNIVRGNDKKKGGYGFITSPDLPFERIFFHWTGLKQDTLRFPDLRKRMKVNFQLKKDEVNGYAAIKIKVI